MAKTITVISREIPNLIEHRIENSERVGRGEKPIDFWETVPMLLKKVEAYAKEKNTPLSELKERIETLLIIGCLKGLCYEY